jgi:hypothetical protein
VTEADRRIATLAARQYNVFNRDQAFRLGASGRLMAARVRSGDWLLLDASVFGFPGSPGTWHRQLKIAELGTRDAAVAGRSAAVLHDLSGFRPTRPEICVPLTTRAVSRFATAHRYAGAGVTVVDGFRCTTIAQTLFDLAACGVGPWAIERAMDDAILGRRLQVADLEERLDAYRTARRHGAVLMRALIEERREDGWTPPESELEAVAAQVLARACPGWVRQHPLPFCGPAYGRVDFALPEQRLVVEADSRRWHARVADFDRDRWRDNEAVAAGWRVLRFTWVHLTAAADDVVALVRRTLATVAEVSRR